MLHVQGTPGQGPVSHQELERLRMENLQLREALRPFAVLAEAILHVREDGSQANEEKRDSQIVWGWGWAAFTYGHLRRASAIWAGTGRQIQDTGNQNAHKAGG